MAMAAAATCELERMKWVKIALAWRDLARGREDDEAEPLQGTTHP